MNGLGAARVAHINLKALRQYREFVRQLCAWLYPIAPSLRHEVVRLPVPLQSNVKSHATVIQERRAWFLLRIRDAEILFRLHLNPY